MQRYWRQWNKIQWSRNYLARKQGHYGLWNPPSIADLWLVSPRPCWLTIKKTFSSVGSFFIEIHLKNCIVSSTSMAALSRGYKPINIITDKLTTLITIALLATLETRQSKLSQRLLELLLGTRNKLANSWPTRPDFTIPEIFTKVNSAHSPSRFTIPEIFAKVNSAHSPSRFTIPEIFTKATSGQCLCRF